MQLVDCPVLLTTRIIGGKWKPLILFYLESKTRRFSELNRLIPGSTKKMLTQQLRELEHDEVIHRKVYAQVPPRVEYSLTRHGQTLRPILRSMSAWGKKHRARHGNRPRQIRRPRSSRLLASARPLAQFRLTPPQTHGRS